MEWIRERDRLPCDRCKFFHAKRGESTPCDTCIPIPIQENADAVNVYMMVRNQVVTAGMGRVVDLNIPAVKYVMELYGVKDQKDCLSRIMKIFHTLLQERVAEGKA
jgi:hypothetical protein